MAAPSNTTPSITDEGTRPAVASRFYAVLAGGAFIALVVASNWLTARFGLVGGLVAAGTFTAGLVLAARDAVRETAGIWASLACIAAGVAASAFMAGPALALASGAAFALSELADTAIYEPLRKRSKLRALAWSNLVGAVVDSVLFLTLAGFPLWPALGGQIAVKWVMSVGLPLLVLGGARAVFRDRFRPEGA